MELRKLTEEEEIRAIEIMATGANSIEELELLLQYLEAGYTIKKINE